MSEISELEDRISRGEFRFGDTVKMRRLRVKDRAKTSGSIQDLIAWIEALEEEIEFLKNR